MRALVQVTKSSSEIHHRFWNANEVAGSSALFRASRPDLPDDCLTGRSRRALRGPGIRLLAFGSGIARRSATASTGANNGMNHAETRMCQTENASMWWINASGRTDSPSSGKVLQPRGAKIEPTAGLSGGREGAWSGMGLWGICRPAAKADAMGSIGDQQRVMWWPDPGVALPGDHAFTWASWRRWRRRCSGASLCRRPSPDGRGRRRRIRG